MKLRRRALPGAGGTGSWGAGPGRRLAEGTATGPALAAPPG